MSPIAWMPNTDLQWVMEQAASSAAVSHNHPEGIKGAQATAVAIFLARTGHDKEAIRTHLSQTFGYDLNRTVAQIRPTYTFSAAAAQSVPEAIIVFLDSKDFIDAIRLAISLGGDSDTIAAIAGSIAQAYYDGGMPNWMIQQCRGLMRYEQLQVLDAFWAQCAVKQARWYYWVDAPVGGNQRGWHAFDRKANANLEGQIQKDKGLKQTRWTLQSGSHAYQVDISTMTQRNLKTGRVRPIRRALQGEYFHPNEPPIYVPSPSDT